MSIEQTGSGIRVDNDRLVRLTSELARFPSHIPDEGPLADFLADWMRASGAFDEVRTQPVVPGRSNVIGVVSGARPGRSLLLNGHTDVPFPTGTWSRDPYDGAVEDGKVFGVGLTDMKGGVACMVAAAEALSARREELAGELVISAVIHHNVCGLGTKFFLANWDRPIDAAINGEPTDLSIQLAHGGAWQFQLTTRGVSKHSSRRGVNAIEKMTKILGALTVDRLTYQPSDIEGLPRLVVGAIEGGHSASRTAETCVARGDIRTVPGMTEDSLRGDIHRLLGELASSDMELDAQLDGLSYQRPYVADESWEVVQIVKDVHRAVTGREVRATKGLPASSYVTDTSDLARAGIPSVIYGPGDWRGDPDESIAIDVLVTAATVYAEAGLRYLVRA